MHDSGERQEFSSGAVRDTAAGKPRMSLMPAVMWESLFDGVIKKRSSEMEVATLSAIRDSLLTLLSGEGREDSAELARSYMESLPMEAYLRYVDWAMKGAEKYSADNWMLGMETSRYMDSLGRHLVKLGLGADDEDHFAAVLWNWVAVLHNETDPGCESLRDYFPRTTEETRRKFKEKS